MEQLKTCSTCKTAFPTSYFHRCRSTHDGLHHQCKACACARQAAYRTAHPEKIKKRRATYRKTNLYRLRAKDAAYRKTNPEKVQLALANWYKVNRDHVILKATLWGATHPEKRRASIAAWKQRGVNNLSDWYIRDIIRLTTSLRGSDIPQAFIEAKRQILIARRLLKETKRDKP